MPVFLLDTNVISDAQKKQPQPALGAWLKKQSKLAIPLPVILEIEIGIVEVSATNPRKAAELRRWRDELLETDFIYPEVTPTVARHLATMQCCRPLKNLWRVDQRSEKHMPGQDLFIAAISIANAMPIATIDRGDFMLIHRHFPLPGLYDPLTATPASRLWLWSPGLKMPRLPYTVRLAPGPKAGLRKRSTLTRVRLTSRQRSRQPPWL